MFIDYAEIKLIAGTGGSGAMAFHREKYISKGGPSGGDGGRGASIYFIGSSQINTLLDIRYQKEYRGDRGEHGKGATQHGKNAENIHIKVPLGTVIREKDTNEVLGDIIEEGQVLLAAKGGRGGRGNAKFATASNRTPRTWEYGRKGEEKEIVLELKLIADIGLVGYPNAGKSTLLSVLSAAKPKIANYPFTTLEPQLGIVSYQEFQNFVMADIPGIIEGASEGKGLGLQFLRHIERTKSIAYVIDLSQEEDLKKTYLKLKKELKKYSTLLLEKPSMIILTKRDCCLPDKKIPRQIDKRECIAVSSVSRDGLKELVDTLWATVQKGREFLDTDDRNSDFNF